MHQPHEVPLVRELGVAVAPGLYALMAVTMTAVSLVLFVLFCFVRQARKSKIKFVF